MLYMDQIRKQVLNEKFHSFLVQNMVSIQHVIMIQHVVLLNHMQLLKVNEIIGFFL
jgi:hypothetical protein